MMKIKIFLTVSETLCFKGRKEGRKGIKFGCLYFFELHVMPFEKSPNWEIQGYCTV